MSHGVLLSHTHTVNNSSNYLHEVWIYGSLVHTDCKRGRWDITAWRWHAMGQNDFKGHHFSTAVSDPLLLTKCSTQAGKRVWVVWACETFFVLQFPLIICITSFNCTSFKETCWNVACREIISSKNNGKVHHLLSNKVWCRRASLWSSKNHQ